MTNERVGEHYSQVDHQRGPAIYASADMYDRMFALGEFEQRPEPYFILDAMCGKGLVGKEVAKRLQGENIPHFVHYLDLAKGHLHTLLDEGKTVSLSSVTETLPYRDGSFDRVFARFGVKNYPKDEQLEILRRFRRLLRVGDIFVLADMEAPEAAYDWMQEERRLKHDLGGLSGSAPHVPTRSIWYQMLAETGLEPKQTNGTMSYVTTNEWVNSSQMSAEDLIRMNGWLVGAPENARTAFNIREEDGLVKIDYPVVIISAVAR